MSLLARFISCGGPVVSIGVPAAGPGWWEYLGSFGDDYFGDDDLDDID